MADVIALLVNQSTGDLTQVQDADVLLVDNIGRKSSSPSNLIIGSNLGATDELYLSSVSALTRIRQDLIVEGQMDADLDLGGNDLTNVGYIEVGAGTVSTQGQIRGDDAFSVWGKSTTDGFDKRLLLYADDQGADGTLYVGQDTGDNAITAVEYEVASHVLISVAGSDHYRWDDVAAWIDNGRELRFYEGVNYVGFEAPAALTGNQIWILPTTDGTAGQVLSTSGGGAGVLSWVTPSGSGDVSRSGSSSDNALTRWHLTGADIQTSGVSLNDTDDMSGINELYSSHYFMGTGPDLGMHPVVDNQSVVATWWGLQLRGHHRATVGPAFSAANVGAADDWCVVIPTGTTNPAEATLGVVGETGMTNALQQWVDNESSLTAMVQIEADGTLDLINHDIAGVKTHTYNGVTAHGSTGTTETFDFSANRLHSATLSANCTISFTAPSGPCTVIVELTNGGAFTPTWPGAVTWPNGTEPTWTTSGVDVIAFYYNGTNYRGGISPDHS